MTGFVEQKVLTSVPLESNPRKVLFKLAPTFGVIFDKPKAWQNSGRWNQKPGRKTTTRKTHEEIENRLLCSCGRFQVAVSYQSSPLGDKAYFRKYCHNCADSQYKRGRQLWTIEQKMVPCALCGFEPEDPCQIDLDHVDGNHCNNEPDNHQYLCANCHRLKTKQNRDSLNYNLRKMGEDLKTLAAS